MITNIQKSKGVRPSGVDWLGDIPASWQLVPTRDLFSEKKEGVGSDAHKYVLLGLTTKGVRERNIDDASGKHPANYDSYQIVYPDDLLMCLFDYDVTPRTVGFVEEKGMVTGAYTRLVPKHQTVTKYYYYYFLLLDQTKELLHLCTGLRNTISNHVFWAFLNPKPTPSEQQRIVEYLDEKTKNIDELIVQKKRMIELLHENRAALITQAITKGIDPNVKLKPSGVVWLGEIPEEWEIQPFMSLFREKNVSNEDGAVQNVLSLSYGNIVDRDVETNFGLLPASFNTYQIVEPGWIVFRLTDLQNDHKSLRTGLVKKRGIITSAYLAVKPILKMCPSYAAYLLHAYDLFKVYYSMGGGVRQSIGYPELKWLPIILPCTEEQKMISDYLDAETAKIDNAVALIELQIDKIKEYRSSMIYSAVTGKIFI